MIEFFDHYQAAHCESGVTTALLRNMGLDIEESRVFGIGSGLFFSYMPFLKVYGIPLITYRYLPGSIFKSCCKRLNVTYTARTYRSAKEGMNDLDRHIAKGHPVAVQTGVYWLSYLPEKLRFHFNAHNIVVIGREGDRYLVSDPILQEPVLCSADDLQRARFAQGVMAPKGKLYYPIAVPEIIDYRKPMRQGLTSTCKRMLENPMPFFGVRGIRYLGKAMLGWREKLGNRRASLYLAQVIRMQEEIGTGGAGFRFMFASFLQDAARTLDIPALDECSMKMTDVGDMWREFALLAARNCKGRAKPEESYERLSDIVIECAEREKQVYRHILGALKS